MEGTARPCHWGAKISAGVLQVDTTNILFICGGAFAGLDVDSGRHTGAGIGFGVDVRDPVDRKVAKHRS